MLYCSHHHKELFISQESEMNERLSTHSHMLNILVTQLLRHGFGIKHTLYFSSDCTEMYSS